MAFQSHRRDGSRASRKSPPSALKSGRPARSAQGKRLGASAHGDTPAREASGADKGLPSRSRGTQKERPLCDFPQEVFPPNYEELTRQLKNSFCRNCSWLDNLEDLVVLQFVRGPRTTLPVLPPSPWGHFLRLQRSLAAPCAAVPLQTQGWGHCLFGEHRAGQCCCLD